MTARTALATGMKDLVLFTNAVLSTRLHEIMYFELEAPKKSISPRKRKLPAAFDDEPINPLKRACKPVTHAPLCHSKYARLDNSDDSKDLGIANPALTTRLTDITHEEILQLDPYCRKQIQASEEALAEIWKLAATTRLPEITYDELVYLDPYPQKKRPSHSDRGLADILRRANDKLLRGSDKQLAERFKWACRPVTTKEPPSFHGKYAKFDSNRCSEAPRIDGVAIPRHLANVIRRDAFDLTESQRSRVAGRLGYEFHSPCVSKEKLTEYYNKQSSGKVRIEAVLYRRKNQLPEANTATPAGDDGMDARGRMIDRVVWSDRENASNASPSKRQRARSPTPIREPVYRQASKYSSETTFYQTLAPMPTPEPVEYEQIELFSRAKGRRTETPRTRYPHISHRILRQELNVRKFDVALEQTGLRKKRGGLMIDLGARLRRKSSDLGRNAKILDAYATAFENWDQELMNSPAKEIKGYASDDKRIVWITTMWEMPGTS